MTIVLCDDAGVEQLRFDGRQIAHVSSREDGGRRSRRWAEVTIYAINGGGFVLHELGQSEVPGETDRVRISKGPDGAGIFRAIVDRRRLTAMDTDALTAAAATDPLFRTTLGDAHEVEDLEPVGVSLLDPSESTPIVLDRDGDRALRFRGRRIGFASTQRSGAGSWMEVSIFAARDGRYVTQKARCSVLSAVPDRSAVRVVRTGLEALQGLVWKGSGHIQTSIVLAAREAAAADPRFASSVGDLIEADNMRRLLDAEEPPVTGAIRPILEELGRGNVLLVDAEAPHPRGWERPTSLRVPPTRVFLALSRRRLIRRDRHDDPNRTSVGWEISPLGRDALHRDGGGEASENTN